MCAVHGCDNKLFTPLIKHSRQQKVCRKHYYAMKSGRVGHQWKRDIHNFHRKGQCECCGVTAYDLGQIVRSQMPTKKQGEHSRIRNIIRLGMMILQGDHIDGRDFDEANHAHNIQTLCPNCHRIKTIASGDNIPVKHR